MTQGGLGMKPYYEHAGITIYHGDCLEILPGLEPVDLVLTDPPYGIGLDASYKKFKNSISYSDITNDAIPFDASHIPKAAAKAIIWGGNCFASTLKDYPGWLAWIKTARNGAKIRQAEMELAWTNFIKRSQCLRWTWIGAYREGCEHKMQHPTQKPLPLMKWCIDLSGNIASVIDPYMGSGTVLVAAKELHKKAIGIEIEEKYCEIAARRLAQEMLPFGSNQSLETDGQKDGHRLTQSLYC